MKCRAQLFKQKESKDQKELKKLIKKIEKEEIALVKCEIPGKEDGWFQYQRPWKL